MSRRRMLVVHATHRCQESSCPRRLRQEVSQKGWLSSAATHQKQHEQTLEAQEHSPFACES